MEVREQTIEKLVAERAGRRAQSARWNANIVIFVYAILATLMLLRFENVPTEIVAPVAATGLFMTWFMGWIRGKKLYTRLYEQELQELQEVHQAEKAEAVTEPPLSPREREVLGHITFGQMNKQIAFQLGVSEQTIKNHVTNILQKLDVDDRTQAAVLAIRQGWVSPANESKRVTSGLVECSPHKH